MMIFNAYVLKARIMPTILIAIPILVFIYFFANQELNGFIDGVLKSKLMFNIPIFIVILFCMSEGCRLLGKNWFERRYFRQEKQMPTTTFLLYSNNHYSEEYKDKVREKILHDFKIPLLTKEQERIDIDGAYRRIIEVMALIRHKLHTNKFLLQHNIEYGFFRNLIGGSPIGVLLSAFNILFFSLYVHIPMPVYISIITLVLYFFAIFLSKVIMKFYGNNYANILFREYMSQ